MADPDILSMIVASDLHLGYREHDTLRGDETFETFEEILRLANEQKADIVVLTGNIFHNSKPSRCTLARCIDILDTWRRGRGEHQLPVYAIHGDCDGPTSELLSPLQLLSSRTSGLLQLISTRPAPGSTTVELSPTLITKGTTKVALYGLDNMPEAAFGRQLQGTETNLTALPPGPGMDCFKICCLHQRHSRRAERTVPIEFDLVLWGHEHTCEIAGGMDALPITANHFCIIQPGSTVHVRGPAGKLGSGRGSGRLVGGQKGTTAHEHTPKHVAMVKVVNDKWKMEQIPLMTVCPAERCWPPPASAPSGEVENEGGKPPRRRMLLTELPAEVLWHLVDLEPAAVVLGCASKDLASRFAELTLSAMSVQPLRAPSVLARLPLLALKPRIAALVELLSHPAVTIRLSAVVTLRALRPHLLQGLRQHIAPSIGSHAWAGAALATLTAHPEETVRCAALAVLT